MSVHHGCSRRVAYRLAAVPRFVTPPRQFGKSLPAATILACISVNIRRIANSAAINHTACRFSISQTSIGEPVRVLSRNRPPQVGPLPRPRGWSAQTFIRALVHMRQRGYLRTSSAKQSHPIKLAPVGISKLWTTSRHGCRQSCRTSHRGSAAHRSRSEVMTRHSGRNHGGAHLAAAVSTRASNVVWALRTQDPTTPNQTARP